MRLLIIAIVLLSLVGCAGTKANYLIRGEYKGMVVVAEITP